MVLCRCLFWPTLVLRRSISNLLIFLIRLLLRVFALPLRLILFGLLLVRLPLLCLIGIVMVVLIAPVLGLLLNMIRSFLILRPGCIILAICR